jgi:hypothetical protein
LLRIQTGGDAMPSFVYLQPSEERLVLSYLNELAGVSSAPSERGVVITSPVRVGELIVKSTCHICHDASGASPDPRQIFDGAIPPLSTLTHRVNEVEFIRKVTHGAPVLAGDPAMPERGRMPVFYYLSQEEADDVYLYLMTYPPRAAAQDAVASSGDRRNIVMGAITSPDYPVTPSPSAPPSSPTEGRLLLSIFGLVSVVGTMLLAGLGITVREFKKLSSKSLSEKATEPLVPVPGMQEFFFNQKTTKEHQKCDLSALGNSTSLPLSH